MFKAFQHTPMPMEPRALLFSDVHTAQSWCPSTRLPALMDLCRCYIAGGSLALFCLSQGGIARDCRNAPSYKSLNGVSMKSRKLGKSLKTYLRDITGYKIDSR